MENPTSCGNPETIDKYRPKSERPCPDCGEPFVGLAATKFCKNCRYKPGNRAPNGRLVWKPTPEIDKIIREKYDPHTKGRVAEIAREIHWTVSAVRHRATYLGVTAARAAIWSQREIDILEEHAGKRTPVWISKRLKKAGFSRTVSGIIGKIKFLGLSRAIKRGYSLNDVAACFGVHLRTAEKWLNNGWLHAKRSQQQYGPNLMWEITEADILRFITEHPTAFMIRYVDQTWFLDLMAANLKLPEEKPKRPQKVARVERDDEEDAA